MEFTKFNFRKSPYLSKRHGGDMTTHRTCRSRKYDVFWRVSKTSPLPPSNSSVGGSETPSLGVSISLSRIFRKLTTQPLPHPLRPTRRPPETHQKQQERSDADRDQNARSGQLLISETFARRLPKYPLPIPTEGDGNLETGAEWSPLGWIKKQKL